MTDYTELLKTSRGSIPKPQLLPVGMWRLQAVRGAFFEPRDAESNPRAVIWYKPKEPLSDVDPDELAELPEDYDFGNSQVEALFFLGELRDWDKLNRHFDLLGMDPDISTEEALKTVGGREVNAFLDKETYTDRNGEPQTKNVPKNFVEAD